MLSVRAYHDCYLCASGCCGHVLEIRRNGEVIHDEAIFIHNDNFEEIEFLKRLLIDSEFNVPIGEEIQYNVDDSDIRTYSLC